MTGRRRFPTGWDTALRGAIGSRLLAAAGIVYALGAFTATFRGPPDRFWQRMTGAGIGLATIAVLGEPELRRPRVRARDVPIGVGAAALLYGIFQAGDRLAGLVMPAGSEEIERIYALRAQRPPAEIAVRLAAVIAPAEELFWRGFLQRSLARRFGRWRGAALAAAAYGGVHLVSRNLTLAAAASTAGAVWCGLYAAGASVTALVISHTTWDIWIFLVAPTSRPAAGDRDGQTRTPRWMVTKPPVNGVQRTSDSPTSRIS